MDKVIDVNSYKAVREAIQFQQKISKRIIQMFHKRFQIVNERNRKLILGKVSGIAFKVFPKSPRFCIRVPALVLQL